MCNRSSRLSSRSRSTACRSHSYGVGLSPAEGIRRHCTRSYKDHTRIDKPETVWIRREAAHEIEITYLIQFEPLIWLEICENKGSWHSKSAESLVFCFFALFGERTQPPVHEPSPLADLNPSGFEHPQKGKIKKYLRRRCSLIGVDHLSAQPLLYPIL